MCARALIDEMTIVITELVLQATIQRRDECTLSIDRIGDEIMVVVRGGTQDDTGSQPPSDGRSVWARFDLKRGTVADDDVSRQSGASQDIVKMPHTLQVHCA